MWAYEKRTQYPVNIKKNDARAAQIIISQYGGPDGEMAASMRYLSQKFHFKNPHIAGLLNDIGREASEMFLSEAAVFLDAFATV